MQAYEVQRFCDIQEDRPFYGIASALGDVVNVHVSLRISL
jgi:hypothetical protein